MATEELQVGTQVELGLDQGEKGDEGQKAAAHGEFPGRSDGAEDPARGWREAAGQGRESFGSNPETKETAASLEKKVVGRDKTGAATGLQPSKYGLSALRKKGDWNVDEGGGVTVGGP